MIGLEREEKRREEGGIERDDFKDLDGMVVERRRTEARID